MNNFKQIIHKDDKVFFAEKLTPDRGLNELQIIAIYEGIDPYKALKNLIDTSTLNYVVDSKGNEAITPALYNECLKDYNITNAYMNELLPILYEVRLTNQNIVYFMCTQDGYESLFVNDSTIKYLQNLAPLEIKDLIIKAQIDKQRNNKKSS